MRRFEHSNGKFWEVDAESCGLDIRWGAIGSTGHQRSLTFAHEQELHDKMRELIAKQVALGYVEVLDTKTLVDSITNDKRWYRRFEGGGDYLALAVDRQRVFESRGKLIDKRVADAEVREQDSFEEAKRTAAMLIAAAITKGMKVVDAAEPRPASASVVRAAGNPELEAMCRAAPDDPAPWAVYADWLMTHNDPRGEIAALRVHGKEAEAIAKLTDALPVLLQRDAGKDSDDDDDDEYDNASDALREAITFTRWRHGFAAGATIKVEDDGAIDLEGATRRFLALPIAMFIDELRFGLAGFESDNDWGPTLEIVLEAPQASSMRVLRFDDFTYSDQEISWTAFGDFSQAWSKLPRLEELQIRSGAGGTLGTIVLPQLKKFVRVSGGLRKTEVTSIVKATWPQLEHLEVWFGRAGYGAEGDAAQLAPIFDAHGLQKLRHLGLVNCEFSASAIEHLAGSRVVRQLHTLDLASGVIATDEVELLIAHAERFKHLTSIDISDNFITPEQLVALQRVLPMVVSRDQRELEDEDDDEDHRYAALGE